jgi:hypothetical protein
MVGGIEIEKVHLDLRVRQVVTEKEGDGQGNNQHQPAIVQEKTNIRLHPRAREHKQIPSSQPEKLWSELDGVE